ncbi:hypothetical protein Scep_014367 [Stephania cephalantha]|uniref:Uncharacterized protein n=1 Tax=Stephania cephalantha TaxID=152367 RepID=A0AAP0J3P5_9MAGN
MSVADLPIKTSYMRNDVDPQTSFYVERSNAQVGGHAGAQTEKVLSQSSNDQGGRHSEDQNALLVVMVESAVSEARGANAKVLVIDMFWYYCGRMISGGFSLEVFKQWAPSEKNLIALPGQGGAEGDQWLRRSRGQATAGGEAGPNQQRRRIAEATASGGRWRAMAGESRGGRTRRRPASASGRITGPWSSSMAATADPKKGAAAVRKKGQAAAVTNGNAPEEKTAQRQRRRRRIPRSGSGAANKLDRARARGDSRSTGVTDERMSRRVAVDVDDGSGRRRRRWWRRIFGEGAAAGIFGVSDEMGL